MEKLDEILYLLEKILVELHYLNETSDQSFLVSALGVDNNVAEVFSKVASKQKKEFEESLSKIDKKYGK